MNKKIILGLVIVLLVISGCEKNKNIDSQNEKILEKIFELENISVNNLNINEDTIFVSIEVSDANEYDTHLIEWWGTIFGISSMLKGDYIFVIIENTVNQEPYTYVSSNVYSIKDFNEDRITDVEFWQESLITINSPKKAEILKAADLPLDTLTDEKDIKIKKDFSIAGFDLSGLVKYIIYGIIVVFATLLIIFGIKKKDKIKNAYSKTKKHREKLHKVYKEKIVPKAKGLKEKAKKKTKELIEKTKNYSTKENKKK
jgi:hypothetical protein